MNITANCIEPEGSIIREVWPFAFTRIGLQKLYEQCQKFPVLTGKPLTNLKDFLDILIGENLSGDPEPLALYWIVDNYVGMFCMDNIRLEEADVHYSFFDRRHKGRESLVRAMLQMVFDQYPLTRLNVYIPAYVGMGPRLFIERCGFKMEGCKRAASWWKGKKFNVYCYGILKEEAWEHKPEAQQIKLAL